MIPSLYVKLIGGLVAALILVVLVADRGRWMHRAHGDEAQLATICASVRAAADNPKLDCKQVNQQIGELGKSIATLKDGIEKQNAAVKALAVESDRQKADAAKAVLNAQGRAKAAEVTSARLASSSRAGGAVAKPCEPSKALQEAWHG